MRVSRKPTKVIESKVGSKVTKPVKPTQNAIAELAETQVVKIENWSQYDGNAYGEKVISEPFTICGTEWELHVCPKGYDDHYESSDAISVSCHIRHLANRSVHCRYSFTLLNTLCSEENVTWSDPEGVVEFGSRTSGNSLWGTEDFFDLALLSSDLDGFLPDDTLSVEVAMEVYGDVHIDSHPLTKAIERAAAREDLIALADSELSLITKTLPGSKNGMKAGDEFIYQDSLLKHRFTSK